MKYKQEIRVDGNITQIFALPCVKGVDKEEGEPVYIIEDGDGHWWRVNIGLWLCEDQEGKWYCFDEDEKMFNELMEKMVDEIKDGKGIDSIVDKYVKTSNPNLRQKLIDGIKNIKEGKYER